MKKKFVSQIQSDSCQEQDIFDNEGFLDSSQSHGRNEITETSIGPLINKVRKIITMFRRSPAKNDLLQQYIRKDFGKDIILLRDCKTRWSRLLLMVERFYLPKDCILKALIGIQNTDDDIQMLFDIITALEPVKTTVKALCRRDSNLFTADIVINFMLKKLKDANSAISKKIYEALLRMEEGHKDLSGLLQYLHSGISNVSGKDFVTVPSIKCLKLIVELLERLNASNPTALITAHASGSSISNEVTLEVDSDPDSITKSICTQKPLSVAEELDKVIKEGYAPIQPIRFETLSSKIQKEMSLFENGGRRGDYLERTYSYLMTIKPTSAESE